MDNTMVRIGNTAENRTSVFHFKADILNTPFCRTYSKRRYEAVKDIVNITTSLTGRIVTI
jgi:hypothetical protein